MSDSGGRLSDLQCSVCAQRGHGCHFGVVACRPCAAFFRRCIAENRTYKCLRGTNSCDIRRDGQRNACKSCRLRLCRAAGMSYQSHQTSQSESGAGGEEGHANEADKEGAPFGGSAPPAAATVAPPLQLLGLKERNERPLLDRMVHAYNALIVGQRSLFLALHADAALHNAQLVTPTSDDSVRMLNGSKPLLFTMLNDSMGPFVQMDYQTKSVLLEEYFPQMRLLHASHLTLEHFPHPNDSRFLFNIGHMIDRNQLEALLLQFSVGREDPQEYIRMKRTVMERMFKFMHQFKLFPDKVSVRDFCALMAVTFWNIAHQKFDGLREEWRAHKEAVMVEWHSDLCTRFCASSPMHVPALQMGRLLSTLVELNSIANLQDETSTIMRIFQPKILQ